MKTFYVDIYFLINFTVDYLALCFSTTFLKISSSVKRLFVASIVGSLYAIAAVLFIDNPIYMIFASVFTIISMIYIVSFGVTFFRKIKLMILFIVFQMFFGGAAYYGFCFLEENLGISFEEPSTHANRNIIIISIIILLAIALIKLIMNLFHTTISEKVVYAEYIASGTAVKFDGLIDSGNLVCDPIDSTPVVFLSRDLFLKMFGVDDEMIVNSQRYKKYLRIIPVRQNGGVKLYYGIKSNNLFVINKDRKEKISVVFVMSKEVHNFGGYKALIPFSAVEEVLYGFNKKTCKKD